MKSIHIILISVVIIFILIMMPNMLSPRQGHLTLLTVAKTENVSEGGVADLYLQIKPGQGDIFIDTYPFTKLDTQVSTRFAKEMACRIAKTDCRNYDFFYTIRARTTIVGGPSAGGAIAALTVAVLDDLPIDQKIAMTGTINSGGIIGPVDGVPEKVAAAQAVGMHTVIVPRWQQSKNATSTLNSNNITVAEVITLDQAIQELTGKDYALPQGEVNIPEDYHVLMGQVADLLCQRTQDILSQIDPAVQTGELINQSEAFLASAQFAQENALYYSAASYCFSANLRLRELQLQNFSQSGLNTLQLEVQDSIIQRQFELTAEPIQTIGDLQTKAIVDERLRESQEYLDQENMTPRTLAYAVERYYSGVVWSGFFQLPGQKLLIDQEQLKQGCEAKLGEAEERRGYVQALFGDLIDLSEGALQDAYAMHSREDYALCLFQASKAKAQIDLILLSIGVAESEFNQSTNEKLSVARSLVYRESLQDRFPVMGYSYYEYADSLKSSDPYTAALFASYALELSDLSMYFPEESSLLDRAVLLINNSFVWGFLLGACVVLLAWRIQK